VNLTDLSHQQLTVRELNSESCAGQPHTLSPAGPKVHLDPGALSIEPGDMLEGSQIEVGGQLAIKHPEDVAVEVRGHALGVVVGRNQFGRILHEVDTEQERVARLEESAHTIKKDAPLCVVEVAYRAAEKDNQLASIARDAVKMRGEVADHGVDAEAREVGGNPTCGLLERRLADVERHKEAQTVAHSRIDEHAGLARRA
jgi:hypothetical protein